LKFRRQKPISGGEQGLRILEFEGAKHFGISEDKVVLKRSCHLW